MILLIGVLIGLVLGLTGAGGSVFSVPLLVGLLKLEPQKAIGISLGAVAVSALYGTVIRIKNNTIQWRPALAYSMVGAAFAPLGNMMNEHVSGKSLMLWFSGLVVVVAWNMWVSANRNPGDQGGVRAISLGKMSVAQCPAPSSEKRPFSVSCFFWMIIGASATGMLSGLFGVGGGFVVVPILMFLMAFTIEQAIATSLVIIALISTTGFLGFVLNHPSMDLLLFKDVALGGVIGMTIGGFVAKWVAGPNLQRVFSILMILMAIFTVCTQLFL